MEKSNQVYLKDITQAIDQILDDYASGFCFADFSIDKKTQDAVIRQIAIIGEAMGKFSNTFQQDHPELPYKEAVSMRNILVHDYDWVDTKEVWKTIETDLPKLRDMVEKILQEENTAIADFAKEKRVGKLLVAKSADDLFGK